MIKVDLCNELSENFLGYAEAVNSDRAIPDARSGLKPVARRIMWIMYDCGFLSNKPHKKSAKSVGEIMGRVHPHGDSSIYEAMVRLAQPWVLRYPLVDFHGNYGNISGDGPAAARYTETRLSKIAEEGMLGGIKKKIVDFQPNYSEDEEEPVTLPSLLPNLLVNPNKGIGVSLACSWLPHNLTEVCDAILETLDGNEVATLPGPDFPTGGIVINKDELASAYKTGKGKAVVRGRYKIEERNRKKLIVFYELPYDVRTEKLLDQINEYCTKEQITDVNEIRDESGKKGMRIVIEVDKDCNEAVLLNKLFKGTDLQKSCSFNQVALVDKKPVLLNLKDCIKIYIDHQTDIIVRAAGFDLEKARLRKHIVDGLLIALEDIDNIIALIKGSESAATAKSSLMEKYSLSETQAKAILDMKLAKLAKLEKIELEQENKELINLIAELEELIAVKDKQLLILRSQLKAFRDKFGDARRTELCNISMPKEEKAVEQIVAKDVVVVVTKNEGIKKIPKTSFRTQKRNGVGVKTQDDVTMNLIRTNTVDYLLLFSDAGKMYKILVDDIPDGTNVSKGVNIHSLVPSIGSNERIILALSLARYGEDSCLVFATKNGNIKKSALKEYSDFKRKTGIAAIKLKEGDSIADITVASNTEECMMITKNGYAIKFELKETPYASRVTQGVKGIKLKPNDEVVSLVIVKPDTQYIGIIYEDGYGKKVAKEDFPSQLRAGMGVMVAKDKTIVGGLAINDDDNILICTNTNGICVPSSELSTIGRTGVGTKLIKDGKINSIARI